MPLSDHDLSIGEAYAEGLIARREWDPRLPKRNNPYYQGEQQWPAWESGWNDMGIWLANHPTKGT